MVQHPPEPRLTWTQRTSQNPVSRVMVFTWAFLAFWLLGLAMGWGVYAGLDLLLVLHRVQVLAC